MQRTLIHRRFPLLISAALVAAFGVYAWLNWQVLLDHQLNRIALLAEQGSGNVRSIFGRNIGEMRAVEEQLAEADKAAARAILERATARDEGILGFALVRADGRIVTGVGASAGTTDISIHAGLDAALNEALATGNRISGLTVFLPAIQRWASPLVAPLNGAEAGALVAWFSVDPEGALWRMINLLPGTSMLLVDAEGVVKYDSRARGGPDETAYSMRLGGEVLAGIRGPEPQIVRLREHALCRDCYLAVQRLDPLEHYTMVLHSLDTAWRIYLQSMIAPALSMGLLLLVILVFFNLFNRMQHRYQQKLLNMAHYDSLTGLPNRVLARDRLAHSLRLARRENWKVAVLFLDLDNFKQVNDANGHQTGDDLLRMVATRISSNLKASDTVARLAGDEFIVILQHIRTAADVERVAQRIIQTFELPFHLEHQEIFCSMSIGISLYPDDADDVDTLLQSADIAMYRAKQGGKNTFSASSRDLTELRARDLAVATELRYAVERGELGLVYQPQYDLVSGTVVGVEALCRWENPKIGAVSPVEFIPAAEQNGEIVRLGEWVIAEACGARARLERAWGEQLKLAINVSVRQVREPGFRDRLNRLVADSGGEPSRLELEITESMLLDSHTVEALWELRGDGYGIAVDDFGTGYAALAWLQRLPVTTLKIDRSFLVDFPEDQNSYALVNTIVFLANSFSLALVAEGVEHPRQRAALARMGCEVGQGFGLCRPQPLDRLLDICSPLEAAP